MDQTRNAKLSELIPDQRNANKGREYGQQLLEKSLRELGAGRSILADKNGNIIAGNKTMKTAASIGMDDIIIVPSDGKKLIVVQRTDLDIDSKLGRELALADNKVSQVNLDFDSTVIAELGDDFGIDLESWGLQAYESEEDEGEPEPSEPKQTDKITFQLNSFQQGELKRALATAKLERELESVKETDGEALMVIIYEYLKRRS